MVTNSSVGITIQRWQVHLCTTRLYMYISLFLDSIKVHSNHTTQMRWTFVYGQPAAVHLAKFCNSHKWETLQCIHRQTHSYSLAQIRPLSIPHHNKQATTTANRRWHIINYGHLNPKQPVSWAKFIDRFSLHSMDSQQLSLCRRHSFPTLVDLFQQYKSWCTSTHAVEINYKPETRHCTHNISWMM